MPTLTGFALPVALKILSWFADHTYVQSDNGISWRCWGRDSGGTAICARSGDSTHANCISQPRSRAGIEYGKTGVCHQTANRILYPARVLVSEAKGYWLSSALYGTYGRNTAEWLSRLARCTAAAGGTPSGGPPDITPLSAGGPPVEGGADPAEQVFLESVVALNLDFAKQHAFRMFTLESPRTDREVLGEELSLIVGYRLGPAALDTDVDALRSIQGDFLSQSDETGNLLMTVDGTPDTVSGILNNACDTAQRRFHKVLGTEVFRSLFDFDIEVDGPVALVNPEMMAAEYGPEE